MKVLNPSKKTLKKTNHPVISSEPKGLQSILWQPVTPLVGNLFVQPRDGVVALDLRRRETVDRNSFVVSNDRKDRNFGMLFDEICYETNLEDDLFSGYVPNVMGSDVSRPHPITCLEIIIDMNHLFIQKQLTSG